MNWTKVQEFYGLKQPFNFAVAVPCLLNVCALAVVMIVSALLFFVESLTVGTERFYFFAYIVALLVLAIAISRYSRASFALLFWCTVELGLALSTTVLETHRIGISYFPENNYTGLSDPRWGYHPLLQIVPRPNVRWTWRVDSRDIALGKKQSGNAAINWADFEGHEFVFYQNSLGLRGLEPTAEDLKRPLIFVYGGSTTYDTTVSQGKTWVERVQADLHNKYAILNWGVVGYGTTEHLIQTGFYQGILGKSPVCAVYYVGRNDLHNAHIKLLDNAYANYMLLLQAVRAPDLLFAKYSPFVKILNEIAKHRFDSIPPQPRVDATQTPIASTDRHLEEIYAEHINTIKAINQARGVRTVFIGQMINREYYKGSPEPLPIDLVRNEDMWTLQARLNQVLKSAAMSGNPAQYIDPGIDNFLASDFTDGVHFTAAGASKFAALVADPIDAYCR